MFGGSQLMDNLKFIKLRWNLAISSQVLCCFDQGTVIINFTSIFWWEKNYQWEWNSGAATCWSTLILNWLSAGNASFQQSAKWAKSEKNVFWYQNKTISTTDYFEITQILIS